MYDAYQTEVIEQHGNAYRVEWFYDSDAGAPWEHCDGHGPVRMAAGRNFNGYVSKAPGEMLLNNPARGRYAYIYDFAEAVKIARRDGWGVDGRTAGERAHNAAMADFEYLRRWVTDEWHYCGIVVTLLDEDGEPTEYSDALWGIESDSEGDHAAIIQDLIGEVDRYESRAVYPVAVMGV